MITYYRIDICKGSGGMNRYMSSIGLSSYHTKAQIKELFGKLKDNVNEEDIIVEDNVKYVEIKASIGDGIGIAFWGTEENGEFELDYYFPYAKGKGTSEMEEIYLEKQIDGECYKGVCDDIRIGVSLIFHVQNSFEYRKRKAEGIPTGKNVLGDFVGLACDGKILLPVIKTEKEIKKTKVELNNRSKLLYAAKQGDEDAMESLTMEDLDTYTMINRRIQKEDVFSIVDSSFIPYGIQCDRYMVIGNILDVEECKNVITGEEVYKMSIECNDLPIYIVINKKELFGEPKPGRRFKGIIWLQGNLIY